jgi:hypothetical protein
MCRISGFAAEFVKRCGDTGGFVGSFGNEQIVHVLLDEMAAVLPMSEARVLGARPDSIGPACYLGAWKREQIVRLVSKAPGRRYEVISS